MRRNAVLLVVGALGAIAFGLAAGLWLTRANGAGSPASQIGLGRPVRARVLSIEEHGEITLGDQRQTYQLVRVEVLAGDYQGQQFSVELGLGSLRSSDYLLEPGDVILVSLQPIAGQAPVAAFADFVRGPSLAGLLGIFVLFVLVVSGWKGVRGLLGMIVSFAVLLVFVLPQILAGRDPVLISIIGSAFLLAATLYLVHGWTFKSHTAVLSTILALIITGLLAISFVRIARLSGLGSEEAIFLIQAGPQTLNLRGLLLGGIIIGALGVLDDLIISQVSVVFELHQANPSLGWRSLYRRAMVIGQDHIAATVNTLVLAYVGASLPLLLLFTVYGEPLGVAVNRELVSEEIVRTLVGSLGLMAAVPIATSLAASVVLRFEGLQKRYGWLGPLSIGSHTGHSH